MGEYALLLVSFFYSSPNIFSFDLDVVDPVVSQKTRLETQQSGMPLVFCGDLNSTYVVIFNNILLIDNSFLMARKKRAD